MSLRIGLYSIYDQEAKLCVGNIGRSDSTSEDAKEDAVYIDCQIINSPFQQLSSLWRLAREDVLELVLQMNPLLSCLYKLQNDEIRND